MQDPAGFAADGGVENFARIRLTELKHGRVSTPTTMGYSAPELAVKLPGCLLPLAGQKFADAPNGLDAASNVPAAGRAQTLAYGAPCGVPQD